MDVLQIVGNKNSGKTTLVSQLITYCQQQDIRVASLKHHGHGGKPLGIENTDSDKHQQAGAFLAGVEGQGLFQISHITGWKIEQLISIYQLFEVELLITEGFKDENYPKIVMIDKEEDLSLLKQLNNIFAVVSAISIQERSIPYPIFSRIHFEDICHFYFHHFR